jgi:hypothetical protein
MSSNFASWLQEKTANVNREWHQCYFETLCFSPTEKWVKDKLARSMEVECVDLMIRLRDEVLKYQSYFIWSDENTIKWANLPGVPLNIKERRPSVPTDSGVETIDMSNLHVSAISNSNINGGKRKLARRNSVSPKTPRMIFSPNQFAANHKINPQEVHFGKCFPTCNQYQELHHQLELIVSLLPDYLTKNI